MEARSQTTAKVPVNEIRLETIEKPAQAGVRRSQSGRRGKSLQADLMLYKFASLGPLVRWEMEESLVLTCSIQLFPWAEDSLVTTVSEKNVDENRDNRGNDETKNVSVPAVLS